MQGQIWLSVFSLRPRASHVRQKQIDLGRLKPRQLNIQPFGRQKIDQFAKLNREHLTIPTGLFGDFVVGDQIRTLLSLGQMVKPNDRNMIQPFQPRRLDTSMAGKGHGFLVDNYRTQKAEFSDTCRDLFDLLFGMYPCVFRVRPNQANWQPFNLSQACGPSAIFR
jgi:hypothetical protein